MAVEFETKILDIDVGVIIEKLRGLGAEEGDDVLMKRWVFDINNLDANQAERYRLRQMGQNITLTYKKRFQSSEIGNTEEIEIGVSDFNKAYLLLDTLKWNNKYYQENYRQVFVLDGIEFSVDRWPLIPAYLEVESNSVEKVEEGLKLLDLIGKDIGDVSVVEVFKKYGVDLHGNDVLKFK